jgi:endogenous inhibitor of DNA gyrase (YacG/DUF329 family)
METFTIVCASCGTQSQKPSNQLRPAMSRGQQRFFCNNECHMAFRRKQTPRYTTKCPQCQTEFTRLSSLNRTGNNSFCSRKCATIFNNKLYPRRKKVRDTICVDCGCSANRKRCGDCRALYLMRMSNKCKKEVTGSELRSHARNQMKSVPKICAKCGYNFYVEVCHLKAVSRYAPDSLLSEINNPCNLRYLCPNHHKELDRGKLTVNDIAVDGYDPSSPAYETGVLPLNYTASKSMH